MSLELEPSTVCRSQAVYKSYMEVEKLHEPVDRAWNRTERERDSLQQTGVNRVYLNNNGTFLRLGRFEECRLKLVLGGNKSSLSV